MGDFAAACVEIGNHVFGEKWTTKCFVDMENYFRNSLKHLDDGAPLEIPRDAAVHMIERAVQNCFRLTGQLRPKTGEFWEVAEQRAE